MLCFTYETAELALPCIFAAKADEVLTVKLLKRTPLLSVEMVLKFHHVPIVYHVQQRKKHKPL